MLPASCVSVEGIQGAARRSGVNPGALRACTRMRAIERKMFREATASGTVGARVSSRRPKQQALSPFVERCETVLARRRWLSS